jgi:hypothetical protein
VRSSRAGSPPRAAGRRARAQAGSHDGLGGGDEPGSEQLSAALWAGADVDRQRRPATAVEAWAGVMVVGVVGVVVVGGSVTQAEPTPAVGEAAPGHQALAPGPVDERSMRRQAVAAVDRMAAPPRLCF